MLRNCIARWRRRRREADAAHRSEGRLLERRGSQREAAVGTAIPYFGAAFGFGAYPLAVPLVIGGAYHMLPDDEAGAERRRTSGRRARDALVERFNEGRDALDLPRVGASDAPPSFHGVTEAPPSSQGGAEAPPLRAFDDAKPMQYLRETRALFDAYRDNFRSEREAAGLPSASPAKAEVVGNATPATTVTVLPSTVFLSRVDQRVDNKINAFRATGVSASGATGSTGQSMPEAFAPR